MAEGSTQSGNIPVPDPSLLTTEQLRRELGSLREVIETRLRGMDRATELIAVELEKQTSNVSTAFEHQQAARDDQLRALKEYLLSRLDLYSSVNDERFIGIRTQFAERDTRGEQEKLASRVSLDAALAAAKEAVGEQNKSNTLAIDKSDRATSEKLNALIAQMTAQFESLNDKITALSSRMDRSEGKSQGGAALWAALVAVAVLIAMAVGIMVNLNK
jgi:hypothetical protein